MLLFEYYKLIFWQPDLLIGLCISDANSKILFSSISDSPYIQVAVPIEIIRIPLKITRYDLFAFDAQNIVGNEGPYFV